MSASQVCVVAQSVCWYLGLRPLAGVCPTLTAAHCCHLLTTLCWAGETESDPHNILLQRVTVMQRLFLTVTDCYNSIDNWYSSDTAQWSVICDPGASIAISNLKHSPLTHCCKHLLIVSGGVRESLSTIDSSCSTFSFSVVISSHKKWTTSLWPKTKKWFFLFRTKCSSLREFRDVAKWHQPRLTSSDCCSQDIQNKNLNA